jgi:hypothetical protein
MFRILKKEIILSGHVQLAWKTGTGVLISF